MNRNFNDENFLLENPTAEYLYHQFAANQPIIDYHCHLSPALIAQNHRFENITKLWLDGDHYKWRAMRSNGVEERFCTGSECSDWERFEKWAECVPYTMRNPLYHWTHLELKRTFGVDKILNPSSAREIYDICNEKLKGADYTTRGLITRDRVEVVCTTDDPIDSLIHHKSIAADQFTTKVLPTWRADRAMAVENPAIFVEYMGLLAQAAECEIASYADMISALEIRHKYFENAGCRLSDHGIEEFYAEDYTTTEIEAIFTKLLLLKTLTTEEVNKFRSAVLYDLAIMDHKSGWVQQFHYGVIRNNNTRMFRQIGVDTGFDSIGDKSVARSMAKFFDRLDVSDQLARTIIYNLNPADNEMVATMIGNFQDGRYGAGKIQFGSGWWFLDQKDGIEKQLNSLSSLGLLSRFVGMLTDSRSFVSYSRHEYFRRILCNLVGQDIEKGLLPASELEFIGREIIEGVCYKNAKDYFKF